MTWTSRYSEKWPRLTALFHLDNGVESDVHENGRYETTFQEPPTSEPFYKFYLHPDDIGRGRSVSQYSMQNAGREGANGSSVCNNANIRMFLGTVLLFSLAGIVAVAVTLAVLLSQPHGSSQRFSKIEDKTFSDRFLIQKEKFLSQELCNMMKDMFKLDANENKPVLDCSVSLLIQDGHMKVDFKIPATDKLMNEDMEKIKQNVLTNIKDLDFGLGVVSNSDDISIYKKDDQMSTTVQIILNTTKSASSVTLAPTTSEVVTQKGEELEGMEALPTTTARLLNVTEGGSTITETTDRGPITSTTTAKIPPGSTSLPITTDSIETLRSTTETLRSTTETFRSTTETLRSTTETLRSTNPLPDHTSMDDLSFLSHFNKTIKDLIQDFQGFGVTENPILGSTQSNAESKHAEHDASITDNSTTMETSHDKTRPYSPEINMDYFGLSLGVSDNLDLNGLQFLGKDVTTQANIQNRSIQMYDDLGVTKTPMVSDFKDVATPRDKNDANFRSNPTPTSPLSQYSTTETIPTLDDLFQNFDELKPNELMHSKQTDNPTPTSPLTQYLTTETIPSLDDLFQNFNFDGLKPNELMHSKQTDNKQLVSTTPTSLTTTFLNTTKNIDNAGIESSTNTSNSTQLSSLQDLYQDFLWNFGAREQTTTKTEYPVHDHSAHSSNPDEHHGVHGLSFSPAHFSKKTIAPELTLTKDSHFDFDGLDSVSTKNTTFETTGLINETNITQNVTLGKNSGESEALHSSAVSANDSLLRTVMPILDGLTTRSSRIHEQSGLSTESREIVIPVSKQEEPLESGVTNMFSAERYSAVTSTPTIITENTALPYPIFRSNSSQTTRNMLSGTFSMDNSNIKQLSDIDLKISAILQSPLVEDNIMTSVVNIVPTQLLSSFNTEYKQTSTPMQKSSRTRSAYEKTAYTDELITSRRSDLPSHFIETSFSKDTFSSSRMNIAEESFSLHSSKIGLIIDDVVFPRQLSFPEQKLADPTLMYFPVMSDPSSLADSSSLNLDNNHSLNDAGWEKVITNSIELSTETGPSSNHITKSSNVINALSSVQKSPLRELSHAQKTSIIPSLSVSRTTSSRLTQHSEVSQSFYFPDNYDTTNDDIDLVLGSNLPFRKYSEHLNKAQHSEIQPSFYTTFVSSSTYEPLSSPIIASELTTRLLLNPTEILDKSLAIQASYEVEHVSNKQTSSTPIINITESFVHEEQTSDSPKISMDLDINRTITRDPDSSSLFLRKSNRTSDNDKGKVNDTFLIGTQVFPNIMNSVTFSDQNLIASIREAVHPSSLSSSLDKSLVEPVQSEEIGVFGTHLQWDALDIQPTKSILLSNSLSTVMTQKTEPNLQTDFEEPSLLHPSTSKDPLHLKSNSKAHDQIPSVYTVTHEPIVYLTIDTRPVTHSSIFIQPTPSHSFQATLFSKLEDLNQDKIKIKSISDDFILSTMKTPTNLAITTSRPKLTPAQFSEIRKRLARLRAAKLENLRRQRNLLNNNFKVGEDFALRREISGSNTAATLVGRGLSVNNRRPQQRPTPRPRPRVTTENPRQRIDRNRLFPGFNTDGQFNRNFFNNIRWNG
ncbi:mucin-3A [Magallana gigas]|uniref:mucin-3A n=1 Tax=Magallana gigas TaxID=29159 RepID=UPI00333E39DB